MENDIKKKVKELKEELLSRLLKTFNSSNYNKAYKLDANGWVEQISHRFSLHTLFYMTKEIYGEDPYINIKPIDKNVGDFEDILNEGILDSSKITSFVTKDAKITEHDTSTVSLLTCDDIVQAYNCLKGRFSKEIEKYNESYEISDELFYKYDKYLDDIGDHDWQPWTHILVELGAPDKKILEDFNKLLKSSRKLLGIDQPH